MVKKIVNGKLGKAYAFFYCSAPKADIEKVLPDARELAQVPNGLELTLREGIDLDNFKQDFQLVKLAQKAHEADNNYSITATLPYSTNKGTASNLVRVQNVLYASLQDKFHKDDAKFVGATIYRSGKGYSFME